MDHIEIYVSNLSASRKFYDWLLPILGFELFQEWATGFSYQKNSYYIVFVQAKDKYLPSNYHRCQVGLNHLAFYCDNKQLLENIHQYCLDNQYHLLYEDRYPHAGGKGSYTVFFEDPDRIKIEIVLRDNKGRN